MGFPGDAGGKESVCNAGDPGSNSGSGRSPGEGNGKPLQYSCLENPMDRGGLQSMGSQKSQTRLSTHTGQDIILHVWPQMECWSWEMLSLKIILQETLYPYFLKFRRVHWYVKVSCNKEIYLSLFNLTCAKFFFFFFDRKMARSHSAHLRITVKIPQS